MAFLLLANTRLRFLAVSDYNPQIKISVQPRRLRNACEERMGSKISVLVCSDLPILGEAVAKLLDKAPDMQVVVDCAKAERDLVLLAKAHRPQVAVLDLHLEWGRLCGVINELFRHNLTVLLMSDAVDQVNTVELLLCGANGIISPKVPPETLYKSVRAVAAGEIWISRQVVAQLVRQIPTSSSRPALIVPESDIIAAPTRVERIPQRTDQVLNRLKLTPREVQIVQAIGDGLTNKDIALTLGISEYTVKHHVTRIFDKVGVDSRLELAMFAIYHGLVETADADVRTQSA